MKIRFSTYKYLFAAATVLFLAFSCKKKTDSTPAPGNPYTADSPSALPKPASDPLRSDDNKNSEQLSGERNVIGLSENVVNGADLKSLADSDSEVDNNFSALTGTESGNALRTDRYSGRGWILKKRSESNIATGSAYLIFFNQDGYYDKYDFATQKWEWGAWYADSSITKVVFDLDANGGTEMYWELLNGNSKKLMVEERRKAATAGQFISPGTILEFNSYDPANPIDVDYATSGFKILSSAKYWRYTQEGESTEKNNLSSITWRDRVSCVANDEYIYNANGTVSIDNKGDDADGNQCYPSSPGITQQKWYLTLNDKELVTVRTTQGVYDGTSMDPLLSITENEIIIYYGTSQDCAVDANNQTVCGSIKHQFIKVVATR